MARHWNGQTFAEKSQGMFDALTQANLKHDDTIIVLEDFQNKYRRRMTVAHISNSGWVDIFIGEIDEDSERYPDSLRHVALTPSQFQSLAESYAAHETQQVA